MPLFFSWAGGEDKEADNWERDFFPLFISNNY